MTTITDIVTNRKPDGRKTDGGLLYQCPFCHKPKRLEIDPHRHLWFCHKCGRGGRVGGKIQTQPEQEKKQFDPSLYRAMKPGHPGWTYLSEERGLPDRLISELQPHEGPTRARVFFPLDPPRRTCYVGRSIVDIEPPYLYVGVGRKSGQLWGVHRVSPREPMLVLTEGVFDAVWERNRLALLGKSLSRTQTDTLCLLCPNEIVFMFDGDAYREATEAACKLAGRFSGRISVVRLPRTQDPDNLRENGQRYIERRERIA